MVVMPATALERFPLYIGGEWIESGAIRRITLPYDGSPVAEAVEADEALFARAVAAAREGARAMASLTNAERSDLLLRVYNLLIRDAAGFARLLCLETGKPIREARTEVERAQQTVLASALEARRLTGEAIPMDAAPAGKGKMAMTVREPLGIIGAITPFNIPLNLAMHKVAPALAAGNAVIHKPAELTPLSALRFARLIEEAGAPQGAYNLVPGDGPTLGGRLVDDPHIAMISFTGSVDVGKLIRRNAGLKRVTLEMGNNSAVLIEPDADLDRAVHRCVTGAFSHSGQLCISVQRILVHEDVAARFTEQLVEATRTLRIGHPLEELTDLSSLITEEEAIRVDAWIDEAVHAGARPALRGKRCQATIPPAILSDVPATTRLSCQEIFGPVVAVNRYRSLEDAIHQANATPYGLQAGIFTRDLERAFSAARRLHVGGVLINEIPTFRADPMPYGGVKDSGVGREGPRYAIEEMTEMKLICWNG